MTSQNNIEPTRKIKELANIVREHRINKQISQRELQLLSGVYQPVISRVESGGGNVKLSTMLKILNGLNLTLQIVPLNKD